MEFQLHIYVFGTTWTKEFFDDKKSLYRLNDLWKNHKDVVSHLTVTRYGKYLTTISNYEDFKFAFIDGFINQPDFTFNDFIEKEFGNESKKY